MNRLLVVLTAALLLALPVGAAQAKSPPKGKYPCYYTTFSGTFSAGTLYITSKSKYNVNKRGKGKYKTKGRRISFKSGSYAKSGVYGVWKKEVGPNGAYYEIKIIGKADKEERFTCEKAPK